MLNQFYSWTGFLYYSGSYWPKPSSIGFKFSFVLAPIDCNETIDYLSIQSRAVQTNLIYFIQNSFFKLLTLNMRHFIFSTGIHFVLYPYDLRNLFFRDVFLFVLSKGASATLMVSSLVRFVSFIVFSVGFAVRTVLNSLGGLSTFLWFTLACCCDGKPEMRLQHDEMAIVNRRKVSDSIFMLR